jgi:outer membrane protein OmpA-like peptidoglycan-associated protein
MNKIFTSLAFCLFIFSIVPAKNDSISVEKIKLKQFLKEGNKQFSSRNFPAATENFEIVLENVNPKKKKKVKRISFQLGESYTYLRDYENAEKNYAMSISNDRKKKNKIAFLKLADALKYQAKYNDAKSYYKDFLNLSADDKKLDVERKKARLEIKGCDYGDTTVFDNPNFTVENAGNNINGLFADFGPALKGNELYFSKISGTDGLSNFSKIYSAEMYNGKFNFAQIFTDVINEEGYYIDNPSFTPNGKTLYYSRCSFSDKKGKHCAIFSSVLENGIWQKPEKLNEFINPEGSNSTQPFIYVDKNEQETLYFVSDRASGRGGKDIWFAQKNENGNFGRAKNMGYPINTSFDEVSPFYDELSQTFYFSSNGHVSLGGLDVFKTTKDQNDTWEEPINMGLPVNSSVDDYDFTLNKDGSFGFLTSNRIGTTTERSVTCCDDIFTVKSTVLNLYVQGLVYVEINNSRFVLDTAQINLKGNDGSEQNSTFNGNFYSFKLEPELWYTITANNDFFQPKSIEFSTIDLSKSDTLYFDIFLKDSISNSTQIKEKLIETIYYEFGKAQLTPESPKTLEDVVKFLTQNPNANIEIAAHTDAIGSKQVNIQVSKQRSEAAKNYLISKGINKNRLTSSWHGMEKPAAPNTNPDGTDNPEGRALNRRTEFILID